MELQLSVSSLDICIKQPSELSLSVSAALPVVCTKNRKSPKQNKTNKKKLELKCRCEDKPDECGEQRSRSQRFLVNISPNFGIHVTKALCDDEVMKKCCLVWGPNKTNQFVMQDAVKVMSRCERFNGKGVLWCEEKTLSSELEAGWSWEQDANEMQEYSAGLKRWADWCISHKEEMEDLWLRKQHNPISVHHCHLYEKS